MPLFSGVCTSTARLDGKTALITGCNTGIGKVTVQDFFERGARVIMACRDEEKAKQAADDIRNSCSGKKDLGEIIVTELDLMSLKSVKNCANFVSGTEERLDLLINNAGVMVCPKGTTEDGFETHFGTNHLGHFLLTLLLLPKLCQNTPARIVNVSSLAHEFGSINFDDINYEKRKYSPSGAYAQSKLANILFTKELARRLKEANIHGVNVYSLHPGVINTELGRHLGTSYIPGLSWIWKNLGGWMQKTPKQGAQTTIYCAVDEGCANETGLYYSDCRTTRPSRAARNQETAKKLWFESLKLVGLDENYDPFENIPQENFPVFNT